MESPDAHRNSSAEAAATPEAVAARGLTLVLGEDRRVVKAVDALDLQIATGQRVAIVGESGSGKSSLIRLLGGLLRPTSGDLSLFGESTIGWSPDRWAALRRREIGIVYQDGNLFPLLTAQENVECQLRVNGVSSSEARAAAREALDAVGLADRAGHRPSELSGGQAQRVAVARAAVMRPALLLADEPTASLDPEAAEEVIQLLLRVSTTLVLVTHHRDLAARMDRSIEMRSGKAVASLAR